MANDAKQSLDKMTPLQKAVLHKLWQDVRDCEGSDMPKAYWCSSCKVKYNRFQELFDRFAHMNKNLRPSDPFHGMLHKHFGSTQSNHPGFSNPDIPDTP